MKVSPTYLIYFLLLFGFFTFKNRKDLNPRLLFEIKNLLQKQKQNIYTTSRCTDNIDAVWIWVNGSDPKFIKEITKYRQNYGFSRFMDYNTLQYSLRSVYQYAPYIKNYYIVTMNQIPSFLNRSSFTKGEYKLRIVDHKEIFPNKEVLPVFNSHPIESVLLNIPNLSSCFLYLNDDMLLGRELNPSHFINQNGLLNIHQASSFVPNFERMKTNLWHQSMGYSNKLINILFHPNQSDFKHPYVTHHCRLFDKNILKEIESKWKTQLDISRQNKFRTGKDILMFFFYSTYVVETKRGIYVKGADYYFTTIDNDRNHTIKIVNHLMKKHPQCMCLNDAFNYSDAQGMNISITLITNMLKELYPVPTPFELRNT